MSSSRPSLALPSQVKENIELTKNLILGDNGTATVAKCDSA